jgi:uncharacterized membrane protein
MKSSSLHRALLSAPIFTLLLLSGSPVHAQKGQGQGGRKGAALKHAQAILGRPLSEPQKKAVRQANAKRQQAIKPIQQKYRAEVAKALGLTTSQYDEREKKIRQKNAPGQ